MSQKTKLMEHKGLADETLRLLKDGFKGNDSLISWMLPPLGYFLYLKKQQYQGEIALVTNLRPLMSEQLLNEWWIHILNIY